MGIFTWAARRAGCVASRRCVISSGAGGLDPPAAVVAGGAYLLARGSIAVRRPRSPSGEVACGVHVSVYHSTACVRACVRQCVYVCGVFMWW